MSLSWLVLAEAVSPLGAASGDVVSYILGYGPLGIAVVVVSVLMYKGWQVMSPPRLTVAKDEARADLLREIERVLAEKAKETERLIEEKHSETARLIAERDAALKAAEQLVPLLTSFVATSQSLIPLLQELVHLIPLLQDLVRKREL
jgi:hypothetical protein